MTYSLHDPLPTNPNEFYERFARDLAWGVLNGRWDNGFYLQGITEPGYPPLQFTSQNSMALRDYINMVWQGKPPNPLLLRDFGYLVAGLGIGDNTTTYKLTALALDLVRKAPTSQAIASTEPNTSGDTSVDKKAVWVVHGRDRKLRDAMFTFLRSLDLKPMEWIEIDVGKGSPYNGEILEEAFNKAQAVVVILSSEDIVRLQRQFQQENDPAYETSFIGQARPNVIFEAGMAFGRYADRTILVEIGAVRPFSDVAGRQVVRMDGTPQARQILVRRLENAKCDVNTKGIDWLSTGDFSTDHVVSIRQELASNFATPNHANVWWLARDLMQAIYLVSWKHSTHHEFVQALRNLAHHAKIASLDKKLVGRIEAVEFLANQMTPTSYERSERDFLIVDMYSLMKDIWTHIQKQQSDFDPGSSTL